MSAIAVLTAVRTYWKLAALGLLALAFAVQTVRLSAAHNKIERREIDIRELRAELERISTERNEQAEKTGQNIGQAERSERESKPIADKIRAAPIPPNCETPGIDLLSNEI
jgi:septal ring factor EnvC (AmiA/AmiB activator)